MTGKQFPDGIGIKGRRCHTVRDFNDTQDVGTFWWEEPSLPRPQLALPHPVSRRDRRGFHREAPVGTASLTPPRSAIPYWSWAPERTRDRSGAS